MRVYLPATLSEIRRLAVAPLAPRAAHGVTPALRALWPDEDEEGWEYAAQASAADASLLLLAADPQAPPVRVVVSADVPDGWLVALDEPPVASALGVVRPVAAEHVVCVHVDEPAAAVDVAAAAAGDESALEMLDERDLLWYDVSEIAQVPAP